MGCGTSLDTMGTTTTFVHQAPVTRTYVPTVIVPQPVPQTVFHVQQQMPAPPVLLQPVQQPSRQPITKTMVVRFVFLSQSIAKSEQRNIIELFHSTKKKKDELEEEINRLRQKCRELESFIQNAPDLNRDAAAANFLGASASAVDAELTPEEKANQEAWMNLDALRSQLVQMEARCVKLTEQTATLKRENDEYMSFVNEQDSILEQAFGGIYGSDLEDELEDKLENMVKKQQYIRSYLDRCKRAWGMFGAATEQLNSATQRWNNFVVNMPISTSYHYNMVKMRGVSEIRNSLISAHQNLISAQRSLSYGPGAINLPYCSPKELNLLQQAINGILYDASMKQRQLNALQFYQLMANRASGLRDTLSTINEKISSDLKQVAGETNQVRSRLRLERVGLMKELAQEAGVEVDIDDVTVQGEPDASSVQEDAFSDEADVAKVEGTGNDEELEKAIEEAKAQITDEEVVVAPVVVDGDKEEDAAKMPLDELAPPPSKNELIGSLDTIMAAYEDQKKALQEEQESAKAKQEARIKEKLRRKKSQSMKAIQEEME